MKIKTVILATVFALSSTLAMAQGAGGGAGGAGGAGAGGAGAGAGGVGADPSLATPSKGPGTTTGMTRGGTNGTAAAPNSMGAKKDRQKPRD
jgi:hypothetical protein